jgi:hypothetical protein
LIAHESAASAPFHRVPVTIRRLEDALAPVEFERIAPALLALAVLTSGLLLYHLTRGSSFWGDDWVWVTTRRATTVHNLLSP